MSDSRTRLTEVEKLRVRVGARRKAERLWPILVDQERSQPLPNLIAPKQLVTIDQLEQFLFEAMVRNMEASDGR